MLTVATVASGAAGYYMDKDNYYFLGNLESRWLGKGAESLGLEGPVLAESFENALAGRLPGDIDLSHTINGKNAHRPGYDLTLSAPKSISVLGVVLGDSRILAAHERAVNVAMSEIEKLASTRIMTEGTSEMVMTGKIIAAAFNHDTSRELDPQLHTHLIVLNATEHDGQWKTLSSDKAGKTGFIENVYALQVALGKIYRNELRQAVENMGFRTTVTGKNDLWEIEGVPVDIFSRRTQQIREAVGDDASLKSRDVAALDTRKVKQKNPDKVELLTEWMDKLAEAGFDAAAFRQEAEKRAADTPERSLQTPAPAEVHAAVSQSISLLSEKRTRFTYSDVLNKTLNGLDARENVAIMARQAIDQAISDQTLIPLDREKGLFTSSIHLLDELSLQQLAGQMLTGTVVRGGGAVSAPAGSVIVQIAGDAPAVAIISQPGGAAALRDGVLDAVSLTRSQGRPVTVLATDRAAERWLNDQPALKDSVITLKALTETDAAERLPEQGTLLVVGAEKLAVRDALTVMDPALRSQTQVLMFDSGGRSGTGNALQTLEDSGVVRYQTVRESRIGVAVYSVADKRQRYAALATEYAGLAKQGETVTAQTSGEREQRALTGDIRQALRDENLLGARSATVSSLIPQWLDGKNRQQTDTYRKGMVMEQRAEGRGAPAQYTIERVSPATRTLTLEGDGGEKQVLKLSQLDSSWSLYRPQQAEVAEGEKLTWLARQGKLRAGDNVTVSRVFKGRLEVEHNGVTRIIRTDEALKAAYGYVSAPGAKVSEQGTVLAAVSGRDTGAAALNTLARSGDSVRLYTPLSQEEATRRLARSPLYKTTLTQVSPQGGDVSPALDAARDALMSVAEKAVRQAVTLTQGSEVVFSRVNVLANALPLHPDLTKAKVDDELARQIAAGELLPAPGIKGSIQQQYVTTATYEAEKNLLRLVAEGIDTQSPLLPHADPALPSGLTAGQQAATRLMLENTDRFIGIQGYAGVGKTTQLKAVIAALETIPEGQRPAVVGLAPTHRAVGEMVSVGVKAQTVTSFLMDVERRTQGGERPDFGNTVFLVDEGSMIGNRDLSEAMTHIAAGGGRAILSGDRDQLLPVENGAPFALLQQRSALDTAIMKDIVRQSPELKPAVYAMIDRQVPAALDVIREVSPATVPRQAGRWSPTTSVMELKQKPEERDEHDRVIGAIVDDFTGRTAQARAQTLIVTQTNADKNAVNTAIHEALQARGELGREMTITVLDRVKTQGGRLKSVAGMAAQHGKIALINDRYYTIRAGQDSRRNGFVELVDENGQAQALAAFESSLRDIAVFEPRQIRVSVGEKVSFSRSDKERGREANSNWTVSAVTKDGNLHLSQGEETRVLNPSADIADRHLDYGYAGTAHKAQGASELYAIVLAGVEGGRKFLASLRDAYVAFSRSKVHVQVYTDNLNAWLSKVTASSDRRTAHDVLHAEEDAQARTAQALWDKASPLSDSALGRALAAKLPGAGEARFIYGSRKYPAPHVAYPAYDAAGKQRGVMLSEIRLDGEGRLAGLNDAWRLLGSEAAVNVVIQRSRNGETRLADSPEAARALAAEYPDTGILVVAGEKPAPRIVRGMTGGIVLPDRMPAQTTAPQDNSNLDALKTPEEQRQARLEQEEARRLQKADPEERRLPAEDDAQRRAEQSVAQELSRETARDSLREQQDTRRAVALERQHSQTEQLRQVERSIIKEKEIGE